MYMILIFCVTDNHDSHSLDRTTEVLRSAYLRDCMSVCLCAYVNNQNPKEPNFRCIFHVAQSSFDSTGVHNVLPVRWISSYLLIIGQIKTMLTPGILCESPAGAKLLSTTALSHNAFRYSFSFSHHTITLLLLGIITNTYAEDRLKVAAAAD